MRIGTRSSHLALLQAEKVAACLRENGIDYEICPQKTVADRFLDKPLTDFGGKALFSRELDVALLEDRVDICVHSLKDLESRLHPDLDILATLKRDPANDMFVLHPHSPYRREEKRQDTSIDWDFLPDRSVVATCAPRRKAFLLHKRPDLDIVPIRGNIERRLALLEKRNYHAIVLSQASFLRSHRSMQHTHLIDSSDMLPASTQGVIAVVGLKESHQHSVAKRNPLTRQALANIHHQKTFLTSAIEREILHILGCNCHSPVAAFAAFDASGHIKVQAEILSHDGSERYSTAQSFSTPIKNENDSQNIGRTIGLQLLQKLPNSFISSLQLQPHT